MSDRIRLCMVAPRRRQCGVSDYSDYLLAELRDLVNLLHVTDAADFTDAVNDADLVHVQHQYFLFGGVAPWKNRFSAFADKLRIPAVLTAHEFVEPHGNPATAAAIRVTNRRNFLHKRIQRILVHTDEDRRRMGNAGIPSERLAVVRHGVPPAPALPPREGARRALGVDEKFVVTLFGFLSRRKGHRLAVEAMRALPGDVVLLLAGGRHPDDQTGYVADLERMIREGGLEDRVRITGYLSPDNVGQVMSATDLILAPFTESSGSGSLALAFACGKPILASRIPPHVEVAKESLAAIKLFQPLHAGALAMEVSSLKRSPETLAALAEGAREYGEAHSYRQMAEETVAIYRDVLGRGA